MIKCPLCGKDFNKDEALCAGCPFHDRCELTRCPNCGYEFVGESKIVNFFANLFKKRASIKLGPRRKYLCPPEK